ncbi:hypothetical protein BSFP_065410 [Burkholderia stabilis]|uniref:Uncharacterized protein n=1 Tax=Burkholderia stabilis TaxID=95485 RepID=A0A1Y1BZ94_9BURK|nr:hypothetical protein BSFP_065410 [Burkholderia stabilis]
MRLVDCRFLECSPGIDQTISAIFGRIDATWLSIDATSPVSISAWPTERRAARGHDGTILARKGNDGVAAFVQRLPGAIGYVEWAYAKRNNVVYTAL